MLNISHFWAWEQPGDVKTTQITQHHVNKSMKFSLLLSKSVYIPKSNLENYLAVGIVDLALVPAAVILNSLFILVIIRYKSLQTNSNTLLILLSVLDIFNGTVTQICVATEVILLSFRKFYTHLDDVVMVLAYSVSGASFYTGILISLERYIAIAFPFIYDRYFHVSRVIKLHSGLLLCWFIFVFLCKVYDIGHTIFPIIVSIGICCGYLITIYCYVNIFRVTQQILRKSSNVSSGSSIQLKDHIQNNRTALVAGLIVMTLFLCYTPYIVVTILITTSVSSYHMSTLVDIVLPWTQTLALCNGIVNPLIYYWRLKEVRSKLILLIQRRRRASTNS